MTAYANGAYEFVKIMYFLTTSTTDTKLNTGSGVKRNSRLPPTGLNCKTLERWRVRREKSVRPDRGGQDDRDPRSARGAAGKRPPRRKPLPPPPPSPPAIRVRSGMEAAPRAPARLRVALSLRGPGRIPVLGTVYAPRSATGPAVAGRPWTT